MEDTSNSKDKNAMSACPKNDENEELISEPVAVLSSLIGMQSIQLSRKAFNFVEQSLKKSKLPPHFLEELKSHARKFSK